MNATPFRSVESPYTSINRSLSEVREAFHRKGRIADANAKLDETVKLMAIHYARLSGRLSDQDFLPICDATTFTLAGVNSALEKISSASPFIDAKGRSIFGDRPVTAFEHGDEELALELFKLAGTAISAQAQASDPLDVVNEAFGHHIRDNFRSNTEDAQYMTPPEVVEFIISIAKETALTKQNTDNTDDKFIVCDPSCGVGSFLVSWHRLHEKERRKNPNTLKPIVVGQDKVDRMARLAKANLIFSGFESDNVFLGNSLSDGSPVSEYDGRVDLVLTNPPFGARFDLEDLRHSSKRSVPQLSTGTTSSKTIDSECLFIERYLTLLRPGGLCIVVVPDGIVSAKGPPAFVRQMVASSAELVAVIELPTVTFAQAGTRTKTAVLAFRKVANPSKIQKVFFAEARELGFEVSRRKGVALKRSEGINELPQILESFRTGTRLSLPSGTFAEWREVNPSACDAWTPRRFRQVDQSSDGLPDNIEFEERPLASLVKPRVKNKPKAYSPGTLFISILHVIGEGILDIPSMAAYQPVTPGAPVNPGSVIISRLNPRIPRVLVVPDLGKPMLCSTEFEILEPAAGVSPYALAFLLLSTPVQDQISSLTAGTSASHSRVRPDEIRTIMLPWPTNQDGKFDAFIAEYEHANRTIVDSIARIAALRSC